MSNVRKSLLQYTFLGANMRRWNDKLRPTPLYEVDKQGHKMIIAFLLCHLVRKDENDPQKLNLFTKVIEGALFDYFYRLVITDLKPPLFYRIKENQSHYKELTQWVIKQVEPMLSSLDEGFLQRFIDYHTGEKDREDISVKILEASHLFASQWEFNLIKEFNTFDTEIKNIEESFTSQLLALSQEEGMEVFSDILSMENVLGKFAHFCGQLRFQVRWSQVSRIPETSVLGHMFLVACYSYFVSIDIKACPARKNNNFFCGLFHDLPELLTRDIISPVKNSFSELPEFIKQYENEELRTRIINPLIEANYGQIAHALSYLLGIDGEGEFRECYTPSENTVYWTNFKELHLHYNEDKYNPKDGALLKSCDTLAAFIEAHTSTRNGISSSALMEALVRMRSEIGNPAPEYINFKTLLADFD